MEEPATAAVLQPTSGLQEDDDDGDYAVNYNDDINLKNRSEKDASRASETDDSTEDLQYQTLDSMMMESSEGAEQDSLELPETISYNRHGGHDYQMMMQLDDNQQVGEGSEDMMVSYPDIQFFHKHQIHQGNIFGGQFHFDPNTGPAAGPDAFGANGMMMMADMEHGNDAQDNSFVFPGDVMEYGEPQFFPGNCISYLETILEETDEEYEEEEGCSGRHWWTADSDTDTDSVIRVTDNNTLQQPTSSSSHQSQQHKFTTNPALNFYRPTASTSGGIGGLDLQPSKLQTVGLPELAGGGKPIIVGVTPSSNFFRTSASSRPFEMEDIHLLDQLDLAFEETLMQSPRKRAMHFASLQQQPQNQPEKPFEQGALADLPLQEVPVKERPAVEPPIFDDNIEPAEVNEEDFFRSSPELTDSDEQEEETSSSSSSGGQTEGVVLAEFSLNSSFSNAINQNQQLQNQTRFRRSFEGSSGSGSTKIKSFRSFDSLNALSGTELLFSKPDTFPSFHDIKEVTEDGAQVARNTISPTIIANPATAEAAIVPTVETTRPQLRTVRKTSDSSAESQTTNSQGLSSENLSEDSGIGGDPNVGGSAFNLVHHQQHNNNNKDHQMNSLGSTDSGESVPSLPSMYPKSEFALNPFVFSSLSSSEGQHSSNFFNSEGSRSNPDLLDGPRRHYTPNLIDPSQLRKISNSEVLLKFSDEDEMFAEAEHLVDMCESIHLEIRPDDECLIFANKSIGPPKPLPRTKISNEEEDAIGNINDESSKQQLEQQQQQLRPMSTGLGAGGNVKEFASLASPPTYGDYVMLRDDVDNDKITSRGEQEKNEMSMPHSTPPDSHNLVVACEEQNKPVEQGESSRTDVTQQTGEISSKTITTLVVRFVSKTPKVPAHESDRITTAGESAQIVTSAETAEEPSSADPSAFEMDSDQGIPVQTKVYGARNEVQVFLVSSRTPSPSPIMKPSSPLPDGSSPNPRLTPGHKKEVHFSPVVSEISWRESYIDQHSSASSDTALDEPETNVDDALEVEPSNNHQYITPSVEIVKVLASDTTDDGFRRSGSPHQQQPNQLSSMVPDLLSHEAFSNTREKSPQPPSAPVIKPTTPPPPTPDQQPPRPPVAQILPSKFASSKSPDKGKKEQKKPVQPEPKETKQAKPGFFERLSKIRISGSSKNKKKVQPLDTKTTSKNGEPSKKIQLEPQSPTEKQRPHAELLNSSLDTSAGEDATFENILDDIAGINNIKTRQQYQSSTLPKERTSSSSGDSARTFAQRKQFLQTLPGHGSSSRAKSPSELDEKLTQFKEDTWRTREQISQSHPDLEVMKDVVRESVERESSPVKSRSEVDLKNKSATSPPQPNKSAQKTPVNKTEREWYKLLKTAAEKYYYRGSGEAGSSKKHPAENPSSQGVVETDLDAGASREMLDDEMLDAERVEKKTSTSTSPPTAAKTQSLTNLSRPMPLSLPPHHLQDQDLLQPAADFSTEDRAKSYEFLLDENHKSYSVPPENKLQLENRQLSEHELRIQRSLQKLNVPEWFKNQGQKGPEVRQQQQPPSQQQNSASSTLSKRSEFGSGSGLAGGWAGLSAYKTSSLSSLQYGRHWGGSINRGSSTFVRGRPATMSASAVRSSKESLLSPSSTASQSPSAFERSSFTYGMPFNQTRYHSSRLSTGTASISPPSTPVNALPSYVKKPYLGWRSQERLNNGGGGAPAPIGSGTNLKLSLYRPPAERLAAEVLSGRSRLSGMKPSDRPPLPKPPPRTSSNPTEAKLNEIADMSKVHDSIREVSEQINQFVNKDNNETPKPVPRLKRPSSRPPMVWMESSFVGTKPTTTA